MLANPSYVNNDGDHPRIHFTSRARHVLETVANAHLETDHEEEQPLTPGRLRVQVDVEVVVAKLLLDRIFLNDTRPSCRVPPPGEGQNRANKTRDSDVACSPTIE